MPELGNLYAPERAEAVENGWRALATTGNWIHPITKKPVVITEERMEGWAEYFSYLKELGEDIPVVKNHSLDPTSRLGSVEDVKITDEGDKKVFWVKEKFTSKEVEDSVKLASRSILAATDKLESSGKEFKDAFIHVGVTDYPVLRGLKNLMAASFIFEDELESLGISVEITETGEEDDDANPNDSDVTEEFEMKLSQDFLTKYGLNENATEADLAAAIAKQTPSAAPSDPSEDPVRKAAVNKIVEDRLSTIKGLKISDEKKKDLEAFCTVEQVSADLQSSGKTLFDIALSSISEVASVKEEEFETLDQSDMASDPGSLVSIMDQYSKGK